MDNRRQRAIQFVERWIGKGREKQQAQSFWIDLLGNVFEVALPTEYIDFERTVMMDHTSFIDGYIEDVKVLIEQKSVDVDLHKVYRQSSGELYTPWDQARRYMLHMPVDEHPKYIVICNFKTFHIYDMNDVGSDPAIVNLEDLPLEYSRLNILIKGEIPHIQKEKELSINAGNVIGRIYDLLLDCYSIEDRQKTEILKSLNMLCVRLVFCFYAEDALLFSKKNAFHDYMKQFPARHWHSRLIELFNILNTKIEDRDPYLEDELATFPYVNGGLFSGNDLWIPKFTEEVVEYILNEACLGFNWSEISPTIFGAVFESTLNPETRRSGGMHYTSVANIHKVINPLFMDSLREEFEEKKKLPIAGGSRTKALKNFQEKLASLVFLDPACGSGNFLTETYIELRKLENDIIRELNSEVYQGQLRLAVETDAVTDIKVSITQFWGIEINDFAVSVAKTALWIAESQMLEQTEEIVGEKITFFPLKKNLNIIENNAIRTEWDNLIAAESVDYIMGNPPFKGARNQSDSQKKDILQLFAGVDQAWDLDYVSCWYMKAFNYMSQNCKAAFISTDSIMEGVQPSILQKVMKAANCIIDFAYEPFKWTNDTSQSAQVFCVVVGFSKEQKSSEIEKYVYRADGTCYKLPNLNWVLRAEDVIPTARKKPLCDVPEMVNGNMERGGVNLILEENEKNEILQKEPSLSKYIKPFFGTNELMGHKKRYCIWLVGVDFSDIANSKILMDRIEKVREHRISSKAKTTRQYASDPTVFAQRPQPEGCDFIIVPRVTVKSKYLPMAFMEAGNIVSDKAHLIPNATLYHFGILVSRLHELWTSEISMKMGTGYSYSKELVYNNFPWPQNPSCEQICDIEKTASGIITVRESLAGMTLKQMYGRVMPPALLKAHMENEKAVLKAYGFTKIGEDGKRQWLSETEVVAALMQMYQELIS